VRPWTSRRSDRGREVSKRIAAGQFESVLGDLAAQVVFGDGPNGAAAAESFRRMARRTGPIVFLRQNASLIGRDDRWDVLSRLGCPALALWGREDRFARLEHARAMASMGIRARLVILDACGHLPTLEQPAAASGAVREWVQECLAVW
jgi:pimeloyl-ACP methyl ester carboxylesterase